MSSPRPKRSCWAISSGMRRPAARSARRREARPPRRQDRRQRAPEQARDLREHQHAVAGDVVGAGQVVAHRVLEHADDVVLVDELVARVEAEDARDRGQREQVAVRRAQVGPEPVGEAQDGDRDVLVALGEALDGVLGLDDVGLQARARRVRALHRLREERRVVALAAVVVRGGLEDDLAHGRVRPAAGGEDVHRPDHVDLVRVARRGLDRVHDEPRVDHRVDLGRLHDPAQQRVLGADADELRALELERRVLRADADDRLDALVALERLGELAAPERRHAGDEDPAHPNQTERRWASMSISSSWMRPRISSATVCTRPRSCHGSSPHWSVGMGSRKRILNLAGR